MLPLWDSGNLFTFTGRASQTYDLQPIGCSWSRGITFPDFFGFTFS
jgi:hypothetical protein